MAWARFDDRWAYGEVTNWAHGLMNSLPARWTKGFGAYALGFGSTCYRLELDYVQLRLVVMASMQIIIDRLQKRKSQCW